eukprot:m.77801 g.77801  ORF g.77801 m.77801 type:complete len:217 (+) comp7930_c0_seq3:210-860(+)
MADNLLQIGFSAVGGNLSTEHASSVFYNVIAALNSVVEHNKVVQLILPLALVYKSKATESEDEDKEQREELEREFVALRDFTASNGTTARAGDRLCGKPVTDETAPGHLSLRHLASEEPILALLKDIAPSCTTDLGEADGFHGDMSAQTAENNLRDQVSFMISFYFSKSQGCCNSQEAARVPSWTLETPINNLGRVMPPGDSFFPASLMPRRQERI